jgi:hypothetical protein
MALQILLRRSQCAEICSVATFVRMRSQQNLLVDTHDNWLGRGRSNSNHGGQEILLKKSFQQLHKDAQAAAPICLTHGEPSAQLICSGTGKKSLLSNAHTQQI